VLTVQDDGSAIAVVGNVDRGKSKVALTVFPNGSALVDIEGEGSAKMAVPVDQPPNLEIIDRSGKVVFQAVR